MGGRYTINLLTWSFYVSTLINLCNGVAFIVVSGLLIKHYTAPVLEPFITKSVVLTPLSLVIVSRILLIFTSLFGVWNVYKTSVKGINIYRLVTFILFLLEVTATMFAVKNSYNGISEHIRNNMYESIPYYGNVSYVTDAWDRIQTELSCCGAGSHNDWYYKVNIPRSCCSSSKSYFDQCNCQYSFNDGRSPFNNNNQCYIYRYSPANNLFSVGCAESLWTITGSCCQFARKLELGMGNIVAVQVVFFTVLSWVLATFLATIIKNHDKSEDDQKQEQTEWT